MSNFVHFGGLMDTYMDTKNALQDRPHCLSWVGGCSSRSFPRDTSNTIIY
jgi:hypothetical protein